MLIAASAASLCAFELLRLDQHFNFLSFGPLRSTLMLIALAYAGACMLLNLLALIGLGLRRFWGFVVGFMGLGLLIPAPAVLLWVWGGAGLFVLCAAALSGWMLSSNRRWFDEIL